MAHVVSVSSGMARQHDTADENAPRVRAGTAAPLRPSVLGATGSIGTNTLDLVARHASRFEVVALTAQCNARRLAELAIAHRAKLAVIGEDAHYAELKSLLAGTGIRTASGASAIEAAAREP